jgi:hypothetical protein
MVLNHFRHRRDRKRGFCNRQRQYVDEQFGQPLMHQRNPHCPGQKQRDDCEAGRDKFDATIVTERSDMSFGKNSGA